MASEKRLIDANALKNKAKYQGHCVRPLVTGYHLCVSVSDIDNAPTVDAVEVEDKELLKAIKILVEQYGHSKRSDYVHSPVAHALYHTWKKVDGERKDNERKAD